MTAAAVTDITKAGSIRKSKQMMADLMDIVKKAFQPVTEKIVQAAFEGKKLAELSELLKEMALPAMGALFQETLQQVAVNQDNKCECPRCGLVASSSRFRSRKFDTLHGSVEIKRRYFHCKQCCVGFSPFDIALGLTSGRKQEDVQKGALALAAELPFDQASELYQQLTGLSFSDHAMHDLVSAKGLKAKVSDILPNKEEIDRIIDEHTVPGAWRPIVVISADGAHLPIRSEEPMGRADKRGAGLWREAKGFRAYIASHDRIIQLASWHKVCDEAEFGLAINELGKIIDSKKVRIAAVADGAEWVWKHIERVFPQAAQVLDYYHCKQHLWTVAKIHYSGDETKQVEWVESATSRLFFNEVENVIWGLQRMKGQSALAEAEIEKLIGYLENNRQRLNYGSAKRGQKPLGSGAIESSNKQVCQVRVKRPGAWWNIEGANAIMAVRCAKINQTLPKLMAATKRADPTLSKS